MQLEVGGQRYPIAAGEMVVGSDAGCDLPLRGEGVLPRHAIVQGLADGSAAIRRAARGADLTVNGIRQGDDPTPVLHGDKIQIGQHELLVVDPTRGGHTQFFDSAAFQKFVPPPPSASQSPGASGGRLVCLTDGREYHVGLGGALVFGRDAGCDVVVAGSEVSRRHARIEPTERGYVLTDTSTNGTFVNGTRVDGTRVLQRADVIRIAGDEFRFYADAPPPEPSPGAQRNTPPTGAHHRLFDTMHAAPGVPLPPPAASPASGPVTPISMANAPIASLLVRSGSLKGKRLTIRVPVVNIGRGDFNDLVLPEPSVSATHAKLQRRDGIWILSDLGSTNGTFVDGERITDETPLGPGATIKFGEVTTLFESTDDVTGIQPRVGTRLVEALGEPGRRDGAADEQEPAPRRPLATGPRRGGAGLPMWAVVALALAALAAAALMLLT
ncbi:MAG TPA: FHA domain-containing protein [Gemmatimonadales bacterium]|nr:FHA domain-containing protein [Gemmatimonadales bacterium]